ncbi:MAG: hypothetical protein HQ517_13020, partial [SAR324 cluster bacterium]|nr:hypothetical protein [SAR324 cluster bacterium]
MNVYTNERMERAEFCHNGFLSRTLLTLLLILGITNPTYAMIISVDGLLSKVVETNQNIRQFYFEMEARIFDPEAFSPLGEQKEENLIPFEIKDNNYFQKIVWVRDEYNLIETLDYAEKPLNMYIFEPGNHVFSKNLQNLRSFAIEDLVYPYLKFFTKHVVFFKDSLEELGINTNRVTIEQRENGVVYQLGSDFENILVDPESFKVLEINRQIQVWGRYFPMQIRFTDWDRQHAALAGT